MSTKAVLASLIGSAGGCGREALPEICPDVAEGELVISELRGDQAEVDSFGHYVEVYNAAGETVDLAGLRVRQRRGDGETIQLFVRESIELAPGAYAVIGPGLPDDKGSWIDYGVGWDISGGDPDTNDPPRNFLDSVATFVELEACGELIDVAFYDFGGLTQTGTAACGNAERPPSAADNDELDAGCWCVDDLEAEGQPLFGVGLPGSPGGANRCP